MKSMNTTATNDYHRCWMVWATLALWPSLKVLKRGTMPLNKLDLYLPFGKKNKNETSLFVVEKYPLVNSQGEANVERKWSQSLLCGKDRWTWNCEQVRRAPSWFPSWQIAFPRSHEDRDQTVKTGTDEGLSEPGMTGNCLIMSNSNTVYLFLSLPVCHVYQSVCEC